MKFEAPKSSKKTSEYKTRIDVVAKRVFRTFKRGIKNYYIDKK